MSKNAPAKKKRVTFEIDEALENDLVACAARTGLGRPELGKVGLIKVIREWRKTGAVIAENLPEAAA